MIGNALFVSLIVFFALAIVIIPSCDFLIPYKAVILQRYMRAVLIFTGVFFFNLFAAVYALYRAVFLKDTGRKLAHIEKQLRSGTSISEELSKRLSEEQ